jgi:hypothetical protein
MSNLKSIVLINVLDMSIFRPFLRSQLFMETGFAFIIRRQVEIMKIRLASLCRARFKSWRLSKISKKAVTQSVDVVIKSSIFWNITPYSSLRVNLRFGGSCCLRLEGRRISQARNHHELEVATYFILVSCSLERQPTFRRNMFLAWLIFRPSRRK